MFPRFIAKLAANLVGLLCGGIHLALVPRMLGPETYGSYVFLLNFFQQATACVDMGVSTGFYVKLSQRQNDRGLLRSCLAFLLCGSLIVVLGAWLIAGTPARTYVWDREPVDYILLTVTLAVVMWWYQAASQVADAYGLTVKNEVVGAATKLVATFSLVAIVFAGYLSFASYVGLQLAAFAIGVAVAVLLVSRHLARSGPGARPRTSRAYAREVWEYSHPLVVYAIFGSLAALLERWLLQTQSGAAQQAYYGFAYQVGTLCFVFTSAMTQLIIREFAMASHAGDRARMASLFTRHIPLFYTIASVFSIFAASRAHDIALLLGGQAYVESVTAITIMALYPMHQTYGQLSGSLYYASGRTRQYRNIGMIGIACGLLLTYGLVAPRELHGMGLGATGLALKMFVIQVVVVNVMLLGNTRLLGISYAHFVANQIKVPAILFILSLIAIQAETALGLTLLAGLLVSAAIYGLLVVGTIAVFPRLFDIRPDDVKTIGKRLWRLSRHGQFT